MNVGSPAAAIRPGTVLPRVARRRACRAAPAAPRRTGRSLLRSGSAAGTRGGGTPTRASHRVPDTARFAATSSRPAVTPSCDAPLPRPSASTAPWSHPRLTVCSAHCNDAVAGAGTVRADTGRVIAARRPAQAWACPPTAVPGCQLPSGRCGRWSGRRAGAPARPLLRAGARRRAGRNRRVRRRAPRRAPRARPESANEAFGRAACRRIVAASRRPGADRTYGGRT